MFFIMRNALSFRRIVGWHWGLLGEVGLVLFSKDFLRGLGSTVALLYRCFGDGFLIDLSITILRKAYFSSEALLEVLHISSEDIGHHTDKVALV